MDSRNTALLDREEEVARKKRTKNDPPKDEHASNFMLRLPEEYKVVLESIRKKHGRAMTVSVQMALERYFRDLGENFTPNWPQSL